MIKEDCQEVQTKDIVLKWKSIVVEIFAFWGTIEDKNSHYLCGKTP